ncbi:TRAP transporter small permease [Salipiger sp. 1_MG-2023]|uniref:TRAP transporter small permease n=1 Tax=Salipiger sp. 1_MG-2023 TaxID=3062665 RepID=UPI0026E3A1DD|nr:TRAP transporter small permease [Salipiger sp. 1_MG-2023]MDO6587557.1 TRAP transporter small permease [Salipiger sp. 1_MG-2023]
MSAILALVRTLASALAIMAGAGVLVLAVLILLDIVGRDLFGVSVQGTDELGGYVLAFVGSLGLSLTLLNRGHPRIDIFLRLFPRPLRAGLHVLAQASIAALGLFMTWHAWGELGETIRFGAVTNTPLQTPLWVPQAVWVAGTAVFALTACLTTLHALMLLASDRAALEHLYGPPTVDEDVAQYTHEETADAGH